MFNRTMIVTAAAVSLTLAVTGALRRTSRCAFAVISPPSMGRPLSIKTRDGKDIKVKLADNASVAGDRSRSSIADIKQGNYIGVSAMPQPDGSQRALHVHVSSPSRCAALPKATLRGTCSREAP